MDFGTVVFWCLFVQTVVTREIENVQTTRDSRKLFGGYRITPKFCKATHPSTTDPNGPSICMFNHECSQRNGQVVGACMDGFLFGACCQLPAGSTGEFVGNDDEITPPTIAQNKLQSTLPPIPTAGDIAYNGVSQITQTLLQPSVLPTAQDNEVVQISEDTNFATTGVTHHVSSETVLLNDAENTKISSSDFKPSTQHPDMEDRSTLRTEDTTVPYYQTPIVHISVSNAQSVYRPSSGFNKPMFKPKPSTDDKYVLVPTIMHSSSKPNKTQEADSIINIIQMLNDTATRKPVVYSTTMNPESTKKATTSYVYSTTSNPKKTTPLTTLTTTTRRKTTKKPSKPNKRKTTTAPPKITKVPTFHSTFASSPDAFITTKKPPSTSYVTGNLPTRRPPPTLNTHVVGPSFSVTSSPASYSTYPSPAPTLIVLSPIDEVSSVVPESYPSVYQSTPSYPPTRPPYVSPRPPYTTATPQKKPVNTVTINNNVVQNIYGTSQRPQPTVLITPKPSISTSAQPGFITEDTIEVGTSPDELMNFPPVRNPNLNMSNPVLDDLTTPAFVEDEALDEKVESFVNKIIQGLQEPFEGLKDVVYNRNKTNTNTTTKKPIKKTGTTTKKPVRTTAKPGTTQKVTTRKPTTKRPTSVTTRKPNTTTTKRSKTTRRPLTTTVSTTQSFIEEDNSTTDQEQYRNQCGIRPLLRNGRIVGGKGATFGEFPWQVLVRESTWLGLFTKNKCGGVLISNKYVMTAAHCQPGFLASLVAVFGEFDISGDLESKRPVSRNVKRVIVHRQYDAATFENDLALLELEAPVQFDDHIIPICLPRDNEDFTRRMATVTGWGRLKYGGGVPSVLQEVQVPIMENSVCQEMFRTAGHSKVILESFLCAGYANGQKDSCEGDSGGPLVLQRPDGRYQLAGTVSHGIKCAAPYLPGVYMRTTYYKPWIVSITGIQSD